MDTLYWIMLAIPMTALVLLVILIWVEVLFPGKGDAIIDKLMGLSPDKPDPPKT